MEKLDPKINPEINKFLRAIYGESQGWVPVVTRSEEGNLDSERWRFIPDEWRGLGINCSVRADEDVYVSVAVFTDKRRTNEDRGAVARAVYADADTCDPKNFRLPPSIVVTTSPGRYHCWWVLDEEVPASEASEAAHRISEAHKKQGCDRGWIVSKILRVPGTTNTKDGQEFTVTAEYTDNVYTLDTINEAYRDVDLNPEIDLNQKMPTKIGSKDLIELEKVISRENLTSLYLEAPQEGQSWSERLFKLELELFRAGLDAKDVFTLARNSACNKYNPDNAGQLTKTGVPIPKRKNPDKVLWAEILKAQAEYEATKDIEVEQQYEPRFVLDQKFLTVDEVRYLEQNPTFIDEYTAWVATRTDSAPTYQKTFAWMILSTLFGERGYLKAKHGVMNLNLWVQVLGDTTSTRKSTALNLYLRVIRKYEELMDDSYLAGSNVTQEGLTKFLKDRDGKVSVLHTDEVNGFFKEVFEKSYQTGLLEFFTELYDGELQVVLRAGKDAGNEKSASTIFNFIGVGIRETTGRILLQEHFSTGFLARMLWCVADPKPRVAGSDAWEEADDEDTKFEDRGLNQVVDNLVDRTRMWHSEDKAVRIKGTAEADARYNQWIEDGFAALDEIGYKDLLTAPYKRLIFSVRKAAALLAMYEQSHVIEIRHMVAALSQSELWFNDMVRMALEVSSTGFERKLDEVESFIRSTTSGVNGVLESTIRKKHSKFKPQEQDEILRALNEQGRIRKVKGTHNRWEVLE